jgi:hypothetical protein
VDAWLRDARNALAEAAGLPPEELGLDDEQTRTLLPKASLAMPLSGRSGFARASV